MKQPLISVCIPVFNGEKYIHECITSVLNQSEGNFELLIIDNDSTDQTVEICRKFTDPRIILLQNTSNIGSIENFNKCIENSKGEFFVLLPADDKLEDDALHLLSEGLNRYPTAGLACGAHRQIDEWGNTISVHQAVPYEIYADSEEAIRLVAENFNPIQHPMVRLKVLNELSKKFEKEFGCFCDIQLWSKILFRNWGVYFTNTPLTALRCHDNQGQSLFQQNTSKNLKILSQHYGESLSSAFYKKNHFNLLFFKFITFFSQNLPDSPLQKPIKKMMLNRLVRSQLKNIASSLLHFNFLSLYSEMALLLEAVKTWGALSVFSSYCSTFLSIFTRQNDLSLKQS